MIGGMLTGLKIAMTRWRSTVRRGQEHVVLAATLTIRLFPAQQGVR